MSWEISQELAAGSRDRSVYRKARLGSCFHNLFFFFCCAGSLHGLFVVARRLLKLRCEGSVVGVLELSCCETSRISVPCLGMEPALEGGFLATGPQAKSLHKVLSAGPHSCLCRPLSHLGEISSPSSPSFPGSGLRY